MAVRVTLTEVEWKLLGELIRERFGLVFEGIRREFLESRLNPRLEALHLLSFMEYYHYILFHPERDAELVQLRVLLTNNETYFFRESHHFDLLTRHVVRELGSKLETRPLRVLSAGCSSGEEVYSAVISLQNAGLELAGKRWEIDGGDLSPRRLAQAREAIYDPISLRACDETQKARYFEPQNGRFALRPRHRIGTRFFELNLVEPGLALGPLSNAHYDVVFCRNVLIYFSPSAFEAAIALFARVLAPGGFLFLGHSESLLDKKTAFTPVCLDGSIVYRKTEGMPT